eukprot:1195785-Prorocentrum_minimum.AAC.2
MTVRRQLGKALADYQRALVHAPHRQDLQQEVARLLVTKTHHDLDRANLLNEEGGTVEALQVISRAHTKYRVLVLSKPHDLDCANRR